MNTRGLFVVAAAVAALLFAAGCGSSDSGSNEVTVQTGSLSKAEFVKKADAICEGARTEFLAQYTNFVKAHKSDIGDKQKEEELLSEVVDSYLSPSVEGQIEKISELGAPKAYAAEVASFLKALQKRVEEASDDPAAVTATPYPFKKAEDIAKKAGMQGCSESFG